MEKPSVTLRHDEGYLLGGWLLIVTALIVALSHVVPADQQTRQTTLFVVIFTGVCSIACFSCGGFTETLDENGIHIKRPFYSKRYRWSDVMKVSVEVVQQYKGKGPEIAMKIKNRRLSLPLAYTQRSMACITCYYGQPDQDKWGKPPTLM